MKKSQLYCLLFVQVLLLFATINNTVLANGQCLDDQREHLMHLKNSLSFHFTYSTKLVEWNSKVDCCSWSGVGCDESGRVTTLELDHEGVIIGADNLSSLFRLQFLEKLNLGFNFFNGVPIPKEIAYLSNLVYLNLSSSGFGGQVPFELSSLRKLVSLDLSNMYAKLENPNLKMLIQNLSNIEEIYLDGMNLSSHKNELFQVIATSVPKLRVLSLSRCSISWPIHISLSTLHNLSVIKLDDNNLSTEVPDFFGNLVNLRTLSLRQCNLVGQCPVKIFQVQALQTLDISDNNLLQGSLPPFPENSSLRKIDLRRTRFSGSLPNSIANLHKLEEIRLSSCNFSGTIPAALGNLLELSYLDLSGNKFSGPIPEFKAAKNLVYIDLSFNTLTGPVPQFQESKYLVHIDLSVNKFSGPIPEFKAAKNLVYIDLSRNTLTGPVPQFKGSKTLVYIDLFSNTLTGPVPEFQESNNLVYIDLSWNTLTGSLSSDHFKGLQNLKRLDLQYNSLRGSLPISLFKLPALTDLSISYNQFSGQIDEIGDRPSIFRSRLTSLDLSSNQFNGSFPKFLFELKDLELLALSSNSFTDIIQLESFKNLPNLTYLDLSYNNLTVEVQSYNSSIAKISELRLVSCKLKSIPEMKGHVELEYLDLSDNQITGEIPNWIWNLSLSLSYVDLSLNSFVGLQKPYDISPALVVLDLHSNQLQGEVPIADARYLDYSSNKFSGPVPSMTELHSNNMGFLSISNNFLTGSIPDSICTPSLEVMDLSNNSLNGTIPSCLVTNSFLAVLNLAGNNLGGSIPDMFPEDCSLETLDLGMNQLVGELPRSLSNCVRLKVLNIGHNKIEDVFPCMFENSSNLHVLVLRSNKFHGELKCFGNKYSWPQIQIIDIASNNFSGVLSSQFFSSLKNMLTPDLHQQPRRAGNLGFQISTGPNNYYEFKVGVTMKGVDMELEKILTIFTTIDFSKNKFSGKIPESIGDLQLLYVLDFSHNEFTGEIPSLIGKLSNLESLDLSSNQLIGEIPSALKELTFLSFLNLSFNILTGRIPSGSQLRTFSMDSYVGNVGLCGFPLNVSCGNANGRGSSRPSSISNKSEIDWMYVSVAVGYTVGLGIFSMFLLFCERWRIKLFYQVDRLL